MRHVRVIRTNSTDPFLNIATELHLFASLPSHTQTLYLWRNAPSVILGRNQNAWAEVRMDQMHQRNITLVRQLSDSVFCFLLGSSVHGMDGTHLGEATQWRRSSVP